MKSAYSGVAVPQGGQVIGYSGGEFQVPDRPIIPFIEGDGTGRDIWRASQRVFDAAVERAYGGKRKIAWLEVYAGEKAFNQFKEWLPQDTVDAIRDFRIAIKGPLTTPVGGGIRSLNVALRQLLDLYACVRPVRYFEGVPTPMLHPERMNVVIYRENTEDVYAGIEWKSGTPEVKKLADFINNEMLKGTNKRLPENAGIGIKPISPGNTKRLVRRAIQHALEKKRRVVTLVHKGNIMKFTEGAFRDWGYELAVEEFRQQIVTERESWIIGNKDSDPNISIEKNAEMIEPGLEQATEDFKKKISAEVKHTLDTLYATHGRGQWKQKLLINDRIADSVFQQVLTRADEYQVFATPNLNGDYISDACAAQVGGLGMAPGANIGDGYGCFEATHGTAPKYADKDVINPSSVILSGVMMFEFMGWKEVGQLIEHGIERTIQQKRVTYDLERLMKGATKVSTTDFAASIIENMSAPAPVGR
ncbi:MAG TPA: NADP-dependent isocitrate dehydrogenase [Candidatus Acidoferrales bacterium]|jgi:isocitrate dehydrogenase|nr:NADP-dependent isocitrate dehydrogenase [Candidatus Acidoferrales bacterium]